MRTYVGTCVVCMHICITIHIYESTCLEYALGICIPTYMQFACRLAVKTPSKVATARSKISLKSSFQLPEALPEVFLQERFLVYRA